MPVRSFIRTNQKYFLHRPFRSRAHAASSYLVREVVTVFPFFPEFLENQNSFILDEIASIFSLFPNFRVSVCVPNDVNIALTISRP